nr:MAG TPA: Bap31/Bap29 transmembrane region [Caudoviricetes sp.]
MELERKRARRIKHQRNLYAGCAIFVLAYAVAK